MHRVYLQYDRCTTKRVFDEHRRVAIEHLPQISLQTPLLLANLDTSSKSHEVVPARSSFSFEDQLLSEHFQKRLLRLCEGPTHTLLKLFSSPRPHGCRIEEASDVYQRDQHHRALQSDLQISCLAQERLSRSQRFVWSLETEMARLTIRRRFRQGIEVL